MYIIIKGTLTGGRRCTGLRGRATRRWSGSCFTGTSPPPTSSSRPQTRSVCCRSADCLSLGGNNSTIESHPFPSILAEILAANPEFFGSKLNGSPTVICNFQAFCSPFLISAPSERATLRRPLPGHRQAGQDIGDHQERRRRRRRSRRGQ